MGKLRLLTAAALGILALGAGAVLAAEAGKDASHGMAMASMSDDQMIASAMKAAPEAVGKDASVIAIGADGAIREVRKGTNGFTCMADNPETPGPDPMCFDKNSAGWVQAWMGHKDPPANNVGLMYMLAGGTDASNTDPWATKPTAENHWVKTGPHIMVVGATSLTADGAGYSRAADPDTSKPYVMWPGTPYEHLMIPVH
jgi:hypothetical protein